MSMLDDFHDIIAPCTVAQLQYCPRQSHHMHHPPHAPKKPNTTVIQCKCSSNHPTLPAGPACCSPPAESPASPASSPPSPPAPPPSGRPAPPRRPPPPKTDAAGARCGELAWPRVAFIFLRIDDPKVPMK